MKFNRKTLFAELREWRGSLSQFQVNGVNFLIDAIERDRYIVRLSWAAYMMATVQHETADTFQPVHEYGGRNYFIRRYGSQTRIGQQLGNDTPEEGAYYAGRGYVQTTGETNYERMEIAIPREYPELIAEFEARTGKKFDLTIGDQPNDTSDPDNAQDPAIAYAIMSHGMRYGSFTNGRHKLSDHLTSSKQDPVNARRIINGTDRAEEIANLFYKWREILKASLEPDLPTPTEIENQIENIKIGAETPTVAEHSTPNTSATETTPNVSSDNSSESPPQNNNANDNSSIPTETVTMDAPAKEGSTGTIAKTTFLGIAVPAFLATIVKAITDAISQGYVSAAQIGEFVMNLVKDNQKYVIWLVIAFIAYLGVKKAFKQASFMLQMWINGKRDMNNIVVKPN